jgi:hypothetical protein
MISTAFSPVMLSCHMPANKTTQKKKKKKGVEKNVGLNLRGYYPMLRCSYSLHSRSLRRQHPSWRVVAWATPLTMEGGATLFPLARDTWRGGGWSHHPPFIFFFFLYFLVFFFRHTRHDTIQFDWSYIRKMSADILLRKIW